VTNIDRENSIAGTGVKFTDMNSFALANAIKRAMAIYENKEILDKSVKRAMTEDFSFNVSAEKYIELYNDLVKNATI